MAIEDISHGPRRHSLAVVHAFLEELSRPFPLWVIRAPVVHPQATALHTHTLLLEPCQPSSPGSCESAHDAVCVSL